MISFSALAPETIGRVVDKFVFQLEEQLADRNVVIELQDSARKWLGEKGYDPLFGARPLARIIQEHIKKPLAEELLFGRLAKGGIVRVSARCGGGQARLRLRTPTDPDEAGGGTARAGAGGVGATALRRLKMLPLHPLGKRAGVRSGSIQFGPAGGLEHAHLTLPSRCDGPLPLPPVGGEGAF